MVDLEPIEKAALGPREMEVVQKLCLCPGCPAYPEADRGEKLAYCLRGDSAHKEQIEPKDCLCEMCEIYKHGRLYGANFFCLEGAALKKGLSSVLSGRPVTALVDEKQTLRARPLFISAGRDVHEPGDDTVDP